MKMLVTGGAGFIGSNFIRMVLAEIPHVNVVNLDALTYAGNLENLADVASNPRYRFIRGDIADRQATASALRDIDVVVNFAAESHNDRAVLDGEDHGFVRVHLKAGTDKILGATIVAAHAGDLLTYFTLAMTQGKGLASLASAIYPYPTQAEIIKRLANSHLQTKLSPWLKRLLHQLIAWHR